MAQSRTSRAHTNRQREHSYAQQKLAEQFRNLLLEVENFVEQIEIQISDLEAYGAGYARAVLGMKHLRNSLVTFHLFAFHYFVYIYEGNPDHLDRQRRALGKIQNEIVPLRPLLEQRRARRPLEQQRSLQPPEQPRSPRRLEFLQLADKLAWDFLARCSLLTNPAFYNRRSPTEGDRKREIQSILVYFEEEALIRQGYAVYNRVPSISLPTSTWCSPWLWLSLAHEVGHYVYQNMDPPDDRRAADPRQNQLGLTLQERVKIALERKGASEAIQKLWEGWLEELFADLFGVLVLGPAYTESYICQWLLPNLGDGGGLLTHDNIHPPDLLRPFVQLELLRQRVKRNGEAVGELAGEIERLDQLWRDICAQLTPAQQREHFAGNLFGFWESQRIGGARVGVRRCLEAFVPEVAMALLQLLEEYEKFGIEQVDIKYYDSDTHIAVQALAGNLVKEGHSHPALKGLKRELSNFSERVPTALLAVAWYAWTKLPKSASSLQPPESMASLRDWFLNVQEFTPQKQPDTEIQLHKIDGLLKMPPAARPQSGAFTELYNELMAVLKQGGAANNGGSMCEALLEVEFSMQHHAQQAGQCCPTNHRAVTCVPLSSQVY